MMTSCTPYSKILFTASGPSSETPSEISSVDSDWSDIRTIALKLGVSNPEDLLTERFKVDRQKLENMIKSESNVDGLNCAEHFFDGVMKSTSTYISWPCRLKVGAKTKKGLSQLKPGPPEEEKLKLRFTSRKVRDTFSVFGNHIGHFIQMRRYARMAPQNPHVRIVGRPEDVSQAKERILANLDSRGTRIIMKIDVSYTDHSYIIGRGGNNIKRIMEETSTHIHFPDSNRSNPTEKSNQVSLCGSLEGVERARSLVRSSTPLLISFELPIIAPGRPVPDHDTPYIKEVENKFNVQVIFSTRPKLHSSLVLVKGSEKEAARVQEATELLINFTCESIASQILVHMQLEISPQHHEIVKGRNNMNLLNIMERTKTKVIFPDVNDMNIKPIKKSQVTITGSIDGVYKARQQLIGNLPIALIFDYPDSQADTSDIINLSHKYGVFISLRQKQRQSTMAVVVKGVEKYIDKVYEARHDILKLSTPLLKPDIPASYFSSKDQEIEGAFRHSLTCLLSNYPDSPLTPGFPITPANYTPPYNNSSAGNAASYQKIQASPPGICAPKYVQQQNLHAAQQMNNNNNNNNSNSNNNYLSVVPPQMRQSLSPRNSLGNTSGYQSFSSSTNSLEQIYPPYSNGAMPSTSRGHYSPDSTYSLDGKNARRLSDGSMSNLGTGEYRTPHYDMKQPHAFDFDMKRFIGMKAMERPPQGEIRTPNSNWVGLGLSATSPAPLETVDSDNMAWNHGQVSPYNLGTTTGLIDSTPSNRRLQLSQHKDIHSLLMSLGLEHYIKTFVLNEIDLDMFASLTEENLVELGITAFGARKKLMVAIHSLLAEAAAASCSMSSSSSPRFSGSAAPGAERRTSSGW